MRQFFNRVVHFVMPVFGEPVDVAVYPANPLVPQTAASSYVIQNATSHFRSRTTGLMEDTYGGDLITVQTLLRGVNPVDAVTVSSARAYATGVE